MYGGLPILIVSSEKHSSDLPEYILFSIFFKTDLIVRVLGQQGVAKLDAAVELSAPETSEGQEQRVHGVLSRL